MPTDKQLIHKAARGTVYVFLGSYAVTAINFISGIVLARILAPEHFGILALAVFYWTAFSVLKDWGAESAVLYRQEKIRETSSTLFFLQVGLSSLAILLALASSFLLKKVYDPQVGVILLVLASFSVVEAMGSIPKTLLEKKIEFQSLSILEVLATLFAAGLAIALALFHFGVWALVAQRISAIFVKTAGFWILSRFRPTFAFDFGMVRWFLKDFGIPIFLSSLASLFLFQYDNFLVGTLVGTTALGFYTRAYSLATLPTQLITQVISRVAFPVYSRCQDDREKLARAFALFLKAIWRLSLPLAMSLFVLAPELIEFLLGEKWLPSVPLLRILVGYSLARILLDDTGPLFSGGLGKPKITTEIVVVQAVLLVILGSLMTYFAKATGTALAVDLVMFVGVLLAYRRIHEELKLTFSEIFLAPLVSSFGALIVVTIMTRINLLESLLLRLILIGGGLILSYLLFISILEGRKLWGEVQILRGYFREEN